MKRLNYFSLFSSVMMLLIGFNYEINAQDVSTEELDLMFYDYKIVNVDSREIHQIAQNNHFFTVNIPKQNGVEFWTVELHNSGIIASDYLSQSLTKEGINIGSRTKAIPTKGYVVGDLNTSVSLTFNEGFIYGYIKDESGYNYIEPLSYYDTSQRGIDKYVVYNSKFIKPTAPHSCGTKEIHDKRKELPVPEHNASDSRIDECFEVEIAIANDFTMFQAFGSVFATEDHAIGVMNNVQTNYDDEFADELQYIIVTQFTVSTSGGDPWSSSADTDILLPSFRSWANGGGFGGFVYDVASLWTDKDIFNDQGSGVIGVAYVGVVCTGSRYNLLENFTNNPQTKRVMVAHELGHNFSSGHDSGSGNIMAPFVSSSTTWSSQSINAINNHVSTRTCLDNCAGSSAPPVADFSFTVIEDCTPGEVQFFNNSTGSGTLDYEWDFPGGTPSFSIEENPFVTYNNAGTYNVTLTVTNAAGSDEEVQFGAISITPSPLPNFSYNVNGTVVSFFNISQNSTNYFWDFGDGTSSANSDPVHDYLDDGVYTVQLTASSICGDVTIEQIIVIANPPTADFQADIQEGCAPLTVQYTSNASNNTDDFVWSFEGGNPAISTEENPTVTYTEAGSFDVSLTVINETGDDILAFTDFIDVKDVPVSDFDYTINENEVTFTNLSSGGNAYVWDFGDGNSSTDENPVHTYGADGDYDVVLTVINECGDNSAMSNISISLLPIASFQTMDETVDCPSFMVEFESTSTNNPDVFEWVFEGGTPATSTLANPTVTYNEPGVYDVSLTVMNANGTNSLTMPDFVTVLDEPNAGFSFTENGLMITFEDQSTSAETYSWDFGDGNTSSIQNPTNTYAEEGIYTIELTVTNQCGTNTSSQTINTYTPVSANFSSDISEGCANLVVQFGDESSANVTDWMWTFPGGIPSTSTEENPVVTYNEAGQYDVILTVSHPESTETITLVNYIAVSDVPVTSFDFFKDIYEVDFTNTTVEGESFVWDFGDGNTSTDESPIHTYAEEGDYTVVLTATNSCGTTTSSMVVSINALPTAGIDAETTSGCGPLTVQFNDASSSNVTSWSWTFEGGNPAASTDENPIVEYNMPGTYNVQLEVTSVAGTDMVVINDFIEVIGVPTAEINYDVDGNVITANNGGSGASSILWTIDNAEITDEQLIYTFPENGTYTVNLTTENDCGTDTESIEVEIDVYPEAMFDALPLVVCVGEEVQLIDNSKNAEEKLWTIFGADPMTSTDDSPIVTYENEGLYTINLLVSNQYGQSSKNFIDVVNVIGLPTASFVGTQADNVVDFQSTASNATVYAWDFGDGTTSNESNPSHTFETNGTFEVTLTVSNECGEFFFTESYTIISNSLSETDLAGVKIYPNPVRNQLNIELVNGQSDQVRLDVLSIEGKLITSTLFNTSNYILDVSNFTPATYLVRMRSEEATFYKKIVVLH